MPIPNVARTDSLGRYSLALPAGPYEVWIGGVADSGFMSEYVTSVTLRPPSVALDLQYIGFRVSGRMIGPGGAALTTGSVFVQGTTNTTLASIRDGYFTLLLPAGTYAIWANPSDPYVIPRVKHEGIVVMSDTTIDLSVDGNEVTGTVTGPGGPLEGAVVSAIATAGTASAYSPTASDGTYRVYLPTREYVFRVEPPHGADSIGVRTYPPILIDAPRTLDFDLSGSAPTPAVP